MRTLVLPEDRNICVSSDTHFHHRKIIKYCLRPWLTSEQRKLVLSGQGKEVGISDEQLIEHDNTLLNNINEVCGRDDIYINAGDVAFLKLKQLKELRDKINCRNIYIVIGNHDDEDDLRYVFGKYNVYERVLVKVGKQKAVIDHYPGDSWRSSHKGYWLLFGHTHCSGEARRLKDPSWALSKDVSVEGHDFRPWLWRQELMPYFEKQKQRWLNWKDALRDKESGGMVKDE